MHASPDPAQQKAAFTFAQDLVKQIITLATGVLTLTLTFVEKVEGTAGPAAVGLPLKAAWSALFLSVLFGLVGLMGLTGALSSGALSIGARHMKVPVILQVLTFVVGVGLLTSAVVLP